MKKIIIAAAIAVCGFMSIPAQAQQADLSGQPWYLIGTTLVPTGSLFRPLVKICYWKRSIYSAGVVTSETIFTQATSVFGFCPAPSSTN